MMIKFWRSLRRPRYSAIWLPVVLLIWVIPYTLIKVFNYSKEQPALYSTSFNGSTYRRKQSSYYPIKSRDTPLTNDNLTKFWGNVQAEEYKITNYTELWEEIHAQIHGDSLYPETYDADKVLYALRNSKIIGADLFKVHTSMKLKLTLEGGQQAIFKVKLIERQNKTARNPCNQGCEHPEYEVVGFTFNRLFGLRNAPYSSGRVLSWRQEIEPVAGGLLRNITTIEDDGSVCLTWKCLHMDLQKYCFQNGQIPGAVMYFLEDSVVKVISADNQMDKQYHVFHRLGVHGVKNKLDLRRLPGDKTYCNKVRKYAPYNEDTWFLDLVDLGVFDFMMSHMDEKHAYYRPLKEEKPLFNVMFDFGHAFCPTNNILALAPLMQCCRIRTRLVKAMMKFKYSLKDVFLRVTKNDPLHPLLLPEVLEDFFRKFGQTLALIQLCVSLESELEVFMDL